MNRSWFALPCLVFAGWLASTMPVHAQQESDGVELARDAFRATRQPWYDADSDGLKPLPEFAEENAERKDWKGAKRPDWSWKWGSNWNWPSFSWLGEIMKWLAWALLIGLIALLVYALAKAFMNIDAPVMGLAGRRQGAEDEITDEQRIENLPIQPQRKKGDFLQMAREYYEAGNFSEAIVYLFSHRLIQLDRAGFIRLTKGKTNRQYVLEMTRSGELRKILGQTIVAFEDVFFGRHELTRDRFEGCWNRNQQFQDLVSQAMS